MSCMREIPRQKCRQSTDDVQQRLAQFIMVTISQKQNNSIRSTWCFSNSDLDCNLAVCAKLNFVSILEL